MMSSAAQPSGGLSFTTCAGLLSLLLAGGVFFLFSTERLSTDDAAQILVVVSFLALLGWIFVAFIVHDYDQKDEADKYEVGADAGGVLVFVPLSLSLLWFVVFVFILGSNALLQQEVFTEALRWQAAAFGGATALGIALIATHRWWLCWRQPR